MAETIQTDLSPNRSDHKWRMEQIQRGTKEALNGIELNFQEQMTVDQVKGILEAYKDKKWNRGTNQSPENSAAGVLAIQAALKHLGYSVKVDGLFGPKTKAMLQIFQKKAGLSTDGQPGPKTINALIVKLNENTEPQNFDGIVPYPALYRDIDNTINNKKNFDGILSDELIKLEKQLKMIPESRQQLEYLEKVQGEILILFTEDLDEFEHNPMNPDRDYLVVFNYWFDYFKTAEGASTLLEKARNAYLEAKTLTPTTPPSSPQ